MPIYEYQCTACGLKLEAFQSMSEDPLKDCPECHESALKKCVTAAAFQLKGSGWYATDFKDQKKTADKATNHKDDAGKTGSASEDGKAEKKGSADKSATTSKSKTNSNSAD